MVKSVLQEKSKQVKNLDDVTQHILTHIEASDRKYRFWSYALLVALVAIGVSGIWKQNQLAVQNKAHIDCIIKLLATPAKPGQVKHIANLATCGIKVSP